MASENGNSSTNNNKYLKFLNNYCNVEKKNRRRCVSYQSENEPDPAASPTMPKTPVVNYSLPTVESPQKKSSSFRSISALVLASQLRNPSRRLRLIIVDCRYPFEYYGGHIKGAINIHVVQDLDRYFYTDCGIRSTLEGLLPVFYCEFSQMRGPAMAKRLRNIDLDNSMDVDFPEIYLLDRGYRNFWDDESLRDLCEPRSYVSMHSLPYRHVLRQYTQHRRSKSVGGAAGQKSKRRQVTVFSEMNLLEERLEATRLQDNENCSALEHQKPQTPRTKLYFEE